MKNRPHEWCRIGLIVSISLAVIPLAEGCSRQTPPDPDVVRPVKTMVVVAGDETRTRVFPATVEATSRVELAFQVPGLLVKFPAKEGQKVAKGELIAQLRQDEFQARVKSLQGELEKARASLAALRARTS
jgi:membrane fusion protein, multidrug efflux system